ncbi:hypothetical protein DXG01_005478, partial [Tephrocybe rancida]
FAPSGSTPSQPKVTKPRTKRVAEQPKAPQKTQSTGNKGVQQHLFNLPLHTKPPPKPKYPKRPNQTQTTNIRTNPLVQVTMAEQRRERMPLSTSRDAPHFMHKQPEEVRRFLYRMETLFELAGITEDQDKKKHILDYVDAQTEKEWRGCDNFGNNSTWKDFVKEIKESYPEAADDEGSVADLDQICREHATLGQGHASELHLLIRKFKVEAKKLKEIIGNRVIINKFMGCLTPAFVDLVQDRLLMKYGHYKDET